MSGLKLTVFGASGGTGSLIVEQALAAGHEVTAVTRRPDAIRSRDSRLHVVHADVLVPSTIERALDGSDAVLSALGSNSVRKPTNLYSHGTAAILAAMAAVGVPRLVVVSAAPVAPRNETTALDRYLLHPIIRRFFGPIYADMARMEALLSGSGCEWVVLRPPRLTDGPPKGRYRMAIATPLSRARSLSRADLAAAMLAAASGRAQVNRAVAIAY